MFIGFIQKFLRRCILRWREHEEAGGRMKEEDEAQSVNLLTPEGWVDFDRKAGFFGDSSGIAVVLSDEGAIPRLAASCFALLKNCEIAGNRRFEGGVLLLPPGGGGEVTWAKTMKEVRALVVENGSPELYAAMVPLLYEARTLTSFDSRSLIEVIRDLPCDSFVIVIDAERYRFSGLPELEVAARNAASIKEISRLQITRLLVELESVVTPDDKFVIAIADAAHTDKPDLDDFSHPNFAIVETGMNAAPQSQEDVATALLEIFRVDFWTGVQRSSLYDPDDRFDLAWEFCEQLKSEGDFSAAWEALKVTLDQVDEYTANHRIAAADVAYRAGQNVKTAELLRQVTCNDLATREELEVGLHLAHALNDESSLDKFSSALTSRFPDSNPAKRAEYLRTFGSRDFEGAGKIAEDSGFILDAAQCKAFAGKTVEPDEYLVLAAEEGVADQAHLSSSEESLYRGHYRQACELASKIPSESSFYIRGIEARFQALRGVLHEGVTEFGKDELRRLMKVTATNPKVIRFRGLLENLLVSDLEEPYSRALLCSVISELIQEKSEMTEASIEEAKELSENRNFENGVQSDDDYRSFIEGYTLEFQNSITEAVVAWESKPGPTLKAEASPTLARYLCRVLDEEELANWDDSMMALLLLHQTCQILEDPNSDFYGLLGVIPRQIARGRSQESRNLAETALQFWQHPNDLHRSWRLSLSWLAFFEACFRSGNRFDGAMFLCLAFLAHEAPCFDNELLRRFYRGAARVYRDFGASEAMMVCVEKERELLNKSGTFAKSDFTSLDVFVAQSSLRDAFGTGEDALLQLLEESENLLDQEVPSEELTLLAIQANILGHLPEDRIPEDALEKFHGRVAAHPGAIADNLVRVVSGPKTAEEIAQIISSIPNAQDRTYLSYQTELVLPALSKGLQTARRAGDIEMFLKASSMFTQPSLNFWLRKDRQDSDEEGKEGEHGSIFGSNSLQGFQSGEVEEIPVVSYRALADIHLAQVQEILTSGETLKVLACEPSQIPLAIEIYEGGNCGPSEIESWTTEAFKAWRSDFKDRLIWSEPKGYIPGIDSIDPPEHEIRDFFSDLHLELQTPAEKLTLIPPSHLFGFTWQLAISGDGFLVEKTSLAIAPSVGWLIGARNTPWVGDRSRKAWMGSNRSSDPTLERLGRLVGANLLGNGFEVSDDDAPFSFQGSEIAFIGAHGGTGFGDYFRRISDGVTHFSATEISNYLAGCGCVILAVCSGGRADSQANTEETLGLVSSLLRVGVRCVVGAPWPLDPELVAHWLPVFLEKMDEGASVGEANHAAQTAVKVAFDHPCAWGQMHLYGDQDFRPR